MKIHLLPLSGLHLIELEPFRDDRGSFTRCFCSRELADAGLNMEIVQVNHSLTRQKGAVRGLHFQNAPHAEIKIVRCLRGKCFDVAVDIRPDSATYLQWHGEILSSKNNRALYIPEGFAHGFQVIEPETELLYLSSKYYTPSAEEGIRYNDPAVAVEWPLPVRHVSKRDSGFALL